MASKVKLDHVGMGAMLKSSEVRSAVLAVAEQVAGNVRAAPEVVRHDAPVETRTYTTDRAAAAVSITHPGGLGMEAKHGTLTTAAAAAGLQVHGG
jgi:hypothetical protein